jgi:hypothetical protein
LSDRPPQAVLWDFERGALMTRALAVAADLGVAEALAAGARSVDELARGLGANADTLHRILRALASDGVFAETAPGVFANTEASELLRVPSRRAFAHLFGGIWHATAGELDARTGGPTFDRTRGRGFWAWLAEHPEERAAFDAAMVDGNDSRAERLARVDWRGDETIVDVGGGNGSLLAALLRDRPGLRGIVFDLPETVRDEAVLGDRVEFVAGSFFENVPCGDAYVLSTILHDWDDERGAAILRAIHAAGRPGVRLVIIDGVIAPGNEPDGTKWLDLLTLALLGGRERTENEWRSLLDSTGFDVERLEDGLIQTRCR